MEGGKERKAVCYREGKEERILLMCLRAELKGCSVWRRDPDRWSHVEEPQGGSRGSWQKCGPETAKHEASKLIETVIEKAWEAYGLGRGKAEVWERGSCSTVSCVKEPGRAGLGCRDREFHGALILHELTGEEVWAGLGR